MLEIHVTGSNPNPVTGAWMQIVILLIPSSEQIKPSCLRITSSGQLTCAKDSRSMYKIWVNGHNILPSCEKCLQASDNPNWSNRIMDPQKSPGRWSSSWSCPILLFTFRVLWCVYIMKLQIMIWWGLISFLLLYKNENCFHFLSMKP